MPRKHGTEQQSLGVRPIRVCKKMKFLQSFFLSFLFFDSNMYFSFQGKEAGFSKEKDGGGGFGVGKGRRCWWRCCCFYIIRGCSSSKKHKCFFLSFSMAGDFSFRIFSSSFCSSATFAAAF